MEELGRLGRKGILARVKESLTYFRGNIDMTEPHKNVILLGRHVNKSVSHDPFSRKNRAKPHFSTKTQCDVIRKCLKLLLIFKVLWPEILLIKETK